MKAKFPHAALALAGALAASACGIDVFVYLYPVSQVITYPSADGDPDWNYYKFRTSDDKNSSGDADAYFKGFEIMYRIYNSKTQCQADASAIGTYNTNNPTTAYTYVAHTKGFSRMSAEGLASEYPLVTRTGTDRTVTVRLAEIGAIAPAFLIESTAYGLPRRTLNEGTASKTFAWDQIKNGDTDVSYAESESTDNWYVQAWVFAYGYDNNYKPSYSAATGLGTITIQKQKP